MEEPINTAKQSPAKRQQAPLDQLGDLAAFAESSTFSALLTGSACQRSAALERYVEALG